MRWFAVVALSFSLVGWGSWGDLVREAELLRPYRHEVAHLERMVELYERALCEDRNNPDLLLRLAELWYELEVLRPESEEEEGWRKAADYGFRAAGLSGLDEAVKLSGQDFQSFLKGVSDGRPLLWAAHGWGMLLGKMNPFSAFFALPKIRALYERVMELNPTYMGGSAFQAYGALLANLSDYGILFGVKLADARPYFEKAIQVDPTYLDHYVAYAKEYAVRIKDRHLFELLLRHVVEAPVGEWTFWNWIAKARAQELLAQGPGLFR